MKIKILFNIMRKLQKKGHVKQLIVAWWMISKSYDYIFGGGEMSKCEK